MPNFIKASYNEKTNTVEYIADNGDRLLRSGGTIAWRFNNPGNLRPGPKYKLHIGQGKTLSGPFLIFPTPEAGRKEKKALLLRKYGDNSIADMLHIYAPPKENDTESYIQHVCKKTGFERNQVIKKLTDDGLSSLMKAMEEREGYHHKKETREEILVPTTTIAFSNGATPLPALPIKVVRDGIETIIKTNDFGLLSPFVHYKPGEVLELWIEDIKKEWKQVDTLLLGRASQTFTYVRELLIARATTAQHNPVLENDDTPSELRYVVQPHDSLAKIGSKFNVEFSKIQKDNGIRNPNKIFPGQVLVIRRGKASGGLPDEKNSALTAASAKKTDSSIEQRAIAERSKEGKGHPIAVIPLDQKRAPWMTHALYEAKYWAGKKEEEIGKTMNYHHKTGQSWFKSMEGDSNAWCASFVNYCLKMEKYQMSQNKARAKSFSSDPNFAQVDKPIFGAIAVFGRKGGGHVAFVYGKQKASENIIVLGGNQGDMITFVARSPTKSLLGFYVPLSYKQFADNEASLSLAEYSVDDLNKHFGIKVGNSGREA